MSVEIKIKYYKYTFDVYEVNYRVKNKPEILK